MYDVLSEEFGPLTNSPHYFSTLRIIVIKKVELMSEVLASVDPSRKFYNLNSYISVN